MFDIENVMRVSVRRIATCCDWGSRGKLDHGLKFGMSRTRRRRCKFASLRRRISLGSLDFTLLEYRWVSVKMAHNILGKAALTETKPVRHLSQRAHFVSTVIHILQSFERMHNMFR